MRAILREERPTVIIFGLVVLPLCSSSSGDGHECYAGGLEGYKHDLGLQACDILAIAATFRSLYLHMQCLFVSNMAMSVHDLGLQFYRLAAFGESLGPDVTFLVLAYPMLPPPSAVSDVVSVDALVEHFAAAYKLNVVSVLSLSRHMRNTYADSVHPGSSCYRHWVQLIQNAACDCQHG